MKRRTETGVGVRARAGLAEHLEDLAAYYAHSFPGCPYGAEAARLRAGEAVEVAGWELSEWAPGVNLNSRYVLGTDNSITLTDVS